MAASAAQNRTNILRFYEAGWNQGDHSVYEEMVAPDFIDHQAIPGMAEGREGFKVLQVIFKGAKVLGINGRRMFETWYQVERFLLAEKIKLDQILTHVIPFEDFHRGFALMQSGEGIKIVLDIAGKGSR